MTRVGCGDLKALRLRPDATSHFLNLSAASGLVASTCQHASLATYWNVFTSLSIPSLLAKNTTSLSTVSKDISYGAGRWESESGRKIKDEFIQMTMMKKKIWATSDVCCWSYSCLLFVFRFEFKMIALWWLLYLLFLSHVWYKASIKKKYVEETFTIFSGLLFYFTKPYLSIILGLKIILLFYKLDWALENVHVTWAHH